MARPRYFNLGHLPTPGLRALVAINMFVYALWWAAAASGPDGTSWMENQFTVSWSGIAEGRLWTLLTSGVSQANLLHLLINLVALTTLGADVERVVGTRGFLHLYAAGSVTAAFGHLLSAALTGADVPCLGASGAVMAVAVVSALLYPGRMLLVFFLIPMPAMAAIGLFVLVDAIQALSAAQDGIAHGAHLGGALYGFLWFKRRLVDYVRERLESLGVRPGDEVVV